MADMPVPTQLFVAGLAFLVLGGLAVVAADEDAFPVDPIGVGGVLLLLAGVVLVMASGAVAFWRRRHPQPS